MGGTDRLKKSLEVRRAVFGARYLDGSLAKADDFMLTFQRITTGGTGARVDARRALRTAR